MPHILVWLGGGWLLTQVGSASWSTLYRRLPRTLLAWTVAVWAIPPHWERRGVVLLAFAVMVGLLALNRKSPTRKKGGTQRLAPRDPGSVDLIDAIQQGDSRSVERFLQHGADPNQVTADGDAPLHLAARGGHVAIVELLIAARADIHIRNRDGKTPLQVAQEAGYHEIGDTIRRILEQEKSPPPAPSVPLKSVWERAQDELAAGRLQAALPLLDEASSDQPDSLEVWTAKGATLARLGRFQEALRCFDRCVTLAADNSRCWLSKGICLMRLGQPAAAQMSFDKALKLAPMDAAVWLCQAEVQEELDHPDEAIASYDKVLELFPDHPSAMEQKAACLADAGRLEEAVVLSKKAVDRHPDDASSWYLRGILLDWMGNEEASTAALERAEHLGLGGDINLLDLRRRWTDPLPRL